MPYLTDKEREQFEREEKQERLACPFCHLHSYGAFGGSPEYFEQWKIKHGYHKTNDQE